MWLSVVLARAEAILRRLTEDMSIDGDTIKMIVSTGTARKPVAVVMLVVAVIVSFVPQLNNEIVRSTLIASAYKLWGLQ